MGYSDQIEILKAALAGYSEQESKLASLYSAARENAEKARAEQQKQLEKQYYADRNEAYADNAVSERNFNNTVSAKGLGFSGEAAQAKINAGFALANRLGELSREKNAASAKYNLEYAERDSELAMEQADKLKAILDSGNNLNAEIAKMELERENSEADRQAAKEANEAKLASEKEINDIKLNAEKELQEAKINAEKEMLASKLNAEKENTELKLNSELQITNAKLKAEQALQEEKTAAEKEMLKAELEAKYGSSSSSGGNSQSSGAVTSDGAVSDTDSGYIPSVSAKELAKQLVSNASENGKIYETTEIYRINKYLLELKKNYDINEDYYNELIFLLRSYGYSPVSEPEMRTQVVTYEAKQLYKEEYDKLYEKYLISGYNESESSSEAKKTARRKEFDYIIKNCNNKTEFRICCKNLGIPSAEFEEYLSSRTLYTSGVLKYN